MEETYLIQAIVLTRRDFNEDDSRITVYSADRGKIDLIARGAKKIKSKLSGNIFPPVKAQIMVVRGKRYDYAGSAVGQKFYNNIKEDFDKLTVAGQAIKIFINLIKPEVGENRIFKLLDEFLNILDLRKILKNDGQLLLSYFIYKLLCFLGHMPELFICLNCRKKITPKNNQFDLSNGGIVCGNCLDGKSHKHILKISDEAIKLLRLTCQNDLNKLIKIKIEEKLKQEVILLIRSFLKYHFNE